MSSADAAAATAPVGLRPLLAAVAAAPPTAVVLVDGPSGAGKSTVADLLLAHWPTDAAAQLLRLDDVYPGWGGLAAGAEQVRRELLLPRAAGREAGWRRWDWAASGPAEWHPVSASRPLVVEGCGALTGDAGEHADVTVWVQAEESVRKARALQRDAGGFDAHWDEWQEQWLRYQRGERPRERAQFVIELP